MFRMLVINQMDNSTIGVVDTDTLPRTGEYVRIEQQGEEITFDLYQVTAVWHEYTAFPQHDMRVKSVQISVVPATLL